MPDEALWATFFDAEAVLDRLGLGDVRSDIVDLGCGYGTFAIAAARRTRATVHAFDIEAAMAEMTQHKAHALGSLSWASPIRSHRRRSKMMFDLAAAQKADKIFVLGATGFIGAALVRRLVDLGFTNV